MLDFPRWKQLWLWFIALAAMAAAVPSFVSFAGYAWPAALPNPKINLGLDLAGGSHCCWRPTPIR
jgi:preprotein translocase subunit SecD